MVRNTALSCLVILFLATSAGAGTKVSGTAQCTAPETAHSLEVGDEAGHVMMISQTKCSWSQPMDFEGVKNKEGVGTSVDDVRGDKVSNFGYFVDTMENGDQAHYRYSGTATLKEGKLVSGQNNWELIKGTGTMSNIRARGTCNATGNPDGTVTWECEGDYESTT